MTVLIIGGGLFGLSTALELRKQGRAVLVLDRSANPPTLDAASSDLNKVVRSEYSNELYARLAMEAIEAWKQEPFKAHFGQVGKIGMSDGLDLFAAEFDRVKAHEARWSSKPSIAYLDSPEAILATLKAPSKLALFENKKAYFNPEGGFARASDAMRTLLELCRAAGVQFEVGDAIKLVLKDGQCLGAELRDGRKLFGDLTVAACGGWAPSLLPDLKDCLVATGQVWATVKLTAEEMLLYKDMPVVACAPTGFYLFPPTEEGLLKFAIHGSGWLNPRPSPADEKTLVSTPRTKLYEGTSADQIPKSDVLALRRHLAEWLPDLATKDFHSSRLCWYCDSPSSSFLIDYHPEYKNLFVTSGDSGHAFKFLPIIGHRIVQALDGTLDEALRDDWSFQRLRSQADANASSDSRPTGAGLLQDLATAADLKA